MEFDIDIFQWLFGAVYTFFYEMGSFFSLVPNEVLDVWNGISGGAGSGSGGGGGGFDPLPVITNYVIEYFNPFFNDTSTITYESSGLIHDILYPIFSIINIDFGTFHLGDMPLWFTLIIVAFSIFVIGFVLNSAFSIVGKIFKWIV